MTVAALRIRAVGRPDRVDQHLPVPPAAAATDRPDPTWPGPPRWAARGSSLPGAPGLGLGGPDSSWAALRSVCFALGPAPEVGTGPDCGLEASPGTHAFSLSPMGPETWMDRTLLPRVAGEGALDPSACPRGSRASDTTFSHPSPTPGIPVRRWGPDRLGPSWVPRLGRSGPRARSLVGGPLVSWEAPR